MKSFKHAALYMCSVLMIAMSSMSSAAEQKDPLQSDPRYVHAVYFLQSMNMDVDEKSFHVKQEDGNEVQFLTILKDGKEAGLLWVHKESFVLGINGFDKTSMYQVSQDVDGKVLIEKQSSKDTSVISENVSKALGPYGVCQYKSWVSFSTACGLEDFFITNEYSLWVGDPMTASHYTWRTDNVGRVFVCPLNPIPGYAPRKTFTCGPQQP